MNVTATEQPEEGGTQATAPSAAEDTTPPDSEAEASAGTENTAPAAERSQSIPRQRFDQVNAKRKEAEAQLEAERRSKADLQAELEQLRTAAKPKPEAETEVELPAGYDKMSEMQRLGWLVRKFSRDEIESATGMKLEDLKVVAGAAKQGSSYATEQRWTAMCQANGLDYADQELQETFVGLVKGAGKTHEEALARCKKLYGKSKPNGASVESEPSVTPTFGGNPVEARTPREASDLAAKNVKVPYKSSTDIIRAAMSSMNKETRP